MDELATTKRLEKEGKQFEKKADRNVKIWAVFGCTYKDAALLYEKAATHYRGAYELNKAAKVYIKLAGYHLKLGRNLGAALAYVDAADMYKGISSKDAAISCFNQAVDQYKGIGRFDMAAIYCNEIAKLYEAKKDLENSLIYFKEANDLSPTSSSYMFKVAQLYAQLELYPRAIHSYEHLAKQSYPSQDMCMKSYLLNAGLCHLCESDAAVAVFKALERYVAIYPTFVETNEYILLADLAAAVYEKNVQRFIDVVKELQIDHMKRHDDWKIKLLSRVKNNLISSMPSKKKDSFTWIFLLVNLEPRSCSDQALFNLFRKVMKRKRQIRKKTQSSSNGAHGRQAAADFIDEENGGHGSQVATTFIDEENGAHGSQSATYFIDEGNIVSNILSRVPVKSLMRFKCVAKHWCELIQHPVFIHSQINQLVARQCYFVVMPQYRNYKQGSQHTYIKFNGRQVSFWIADGRGKVTSIIKRITSSTTPFSYSRVTGPVNGLMCFISDSAHAVCVYNITTREITPWVQSAFWMEEKQKFRRMGKSTTYSFGYDPAGKKYKVICKWVIHRGYNATYQAWEILTLGGHNSSWRRLDEVPDFHFSPDAPSVHVNGTIYWYPVDSLSKDAAAVKFLLAFDIGSEKFREIEIPKNYWFQPYFSSNGQCVIFLLDMQSRVGILYTNDKYTVRVMMYEDTASDTVVNPKWTRIAAFLPITKDEALYFHGVAGTKDQILLETHEKDDTGTTIAISLYRLEDLLFKPIEIRELSSSVSDCDWEYGGLCTSFCENLISFKDSDKQ